MKTQIKKYLLPLILFIAFAAFVRIYPAIHGKSYSGQGSIQYNYTNGDHYERIGTTLSLTSDISDSYGSKMTILPGYRVHLTDFEHCIASDVFDLCKKYGKNGQYSPSSGKFSSVGIGTGTENYRYAPLKGDIFINTCAAILFGIFYRHIWGRYFYAVFSVIFILLVYAASERFKNRRLTTVQRKAEFSEKARPLLMLMIYTFLSAFILNILTGLILPHFLPENCAAPGRFSARSGQYAFFWGNVVTIFIFVLTLCVFILKIFPKNRKLLFAYLMPTIFFCAAYYPLAYIFFFEYLSVGMFVRPFIPIYTKLFFYVFSLLPELFLYLAFGGLYTRTTAKKIVYSTVFAFCTSALWLINGAATVYLSAF